jgi:hypothetical protein
MLGFLSSNQKSNSFYLTTYYATRLKVYCVFLSHYCIIHPAFCFSFLLWENKVTTLEKNNYFFLQPFVPFSKGHHLVNMFYQKWKKKIKTLNSRTSKWQIPRTSNLLVRGSTLLTSIKLTQSKLILK